MHEVKYADYEAIYVGWTTCQLTTCQKEHIYLIERNPKNAYDLNILESRSMIPT